MRTVFESTDVLVVAETASGMRSTGTAIAVIGATILTSGIISRSVAATIIGGIVLSIGALFCLLPSIRTFEFNRAQQRLAVTRRRIWESHDREQREEHALEEVVAVQVDESRSSDSGSTWRVIVRLADGRVLPFTSYYTSGLRSKLDIANRLSLFLGLVPGTQSIGGQASPHAIVRRSRRPTVAVAILSWVFGTVFGSIGGTMLMRETRQLSEWRPVQATVLRTSVDSRTDSDGNTYLPVVEYRYAVNDRVYSSNRTMPIRESRSGRWAYNVIKEFRPGATYTAWYDPQDPSQAFIVRSHSIVAPVFAAIGAIVIVVGCGVAVAARRGD